MKSPWSEWQDEGLVLKPTHNDLHVDCFVDADFAGLWPYKDKQDQSGVKSCTSFAICIANCPIVWTSKLQPDMPPLPWRLSTAH